MYWHCPPPRPHVPGCDKEFTAIYLGDVHSNQYMDKWEGIPGAESAWTLNGTKFDFDNLDNHVVRMTAHDKDRNGYLHGDKNNWYGFERFTTDQKVQVTGTNKWVNSFKFDAISKFKATVFYEDGSEAKAILTVIQDDLGRTFVVPSLNKAENAPLEAGKLAGIRLDKAIKDPFRNNMAICRPDLDLVCFVAGTLLLTPEGLRPIEDIAVGDLVMTVDRGPQPVRWHGRRTLDVIDLGTTPRLRPVRIRAGALGDNLPQRDLLVSPQHRVLVSSEIAREMTGADEVLIAAKHLIDMVEGVEVANEMTEVTYHHILFDEHEVVFSEGLRSESLFTGKQALKSMGKAACEEIMTLFPELRDSNPTEGARPFLPGKAARQMARMHAGMALQ